MKRLQPKSVNRNQPLSSTLFLLLMAVALISGCGLFRDDTAPDPLIDIWVSDSPRYAGASLEITPKLIVFNTINGQTHVNFIVNIEKKDGEGETLYDILYKDREGLEYTLSLSLRQRGKEKVLQFRNQTDMEWKPEGEEG
jgi:hypothetical protein